MKNSKETLDKIKFHKEKAEGLKEMIKKLEGELAVENRLIKELDDARTHRINTAKFKKNIAEMVRKQDLVVSALRIIGSPATAGPICDQLALVGIKCHNSEFATMFLPHVRQDKRIKITQVNASKNEYALNEWKK